MKNGTVYEIVDSRYSEIFEKNFYDLKEVYGDWKVSGAAEDALKPASTVSHILGAVDKRLESIVEEDVKRLKAIISGELDHVDAMSKCKTFDPMSADVIHLRDGLAHANSIIAWINNHIAQAREFLNEEGEPDEEV